MHSLVVYESMFGNTRDVALAVADGLSVHGPVDTVEVGAAPRELPADVDLVVVGAPTHAFGMSRPSTRADAARQEPHTLVSTGIGVREWLEAVRAEGYPASAAFDTRADRPRLPGSAAKAVGRRLRRLGFPAAAPARSFHVDGTKGPLVAGELERARAWGAGLGAAVAGAHA